MNAIRAIGPGLVLSFGIAAAAQFITTRFGGPVMLIAILIGIAFNFLRHTKTWSAGIYFASKRVLQLGIVLLGATITMGEILSLGAGTAILVIACVSGTLIAGTWIAKRFGLSADHAVLSAGAVAICGASAAMAISSVLPNTEKSERNIVLTVVGVTTLSTIAMVAYPPLAHLLGFSDRAAGIFLGATIHDVAQVIGAGYTVSDDAGSTAAIVKLMRVALLAPVVIIIAAFFKNSQSDTSAASRAFPLFLFGFAALMALNSLGWVSPDLRHTMGTVSRWCLVTAVAGLGVRTSIKEISALGPNPVSALIAQTIFLAILGIALINVLSLGTRFELV